MIAALVGIDERHEHVAVGLDAPGECGLGVEVRRRRAERELEPRVRADAASEAHQRHRRIDVKAVVQRAEVGVALDDADEELPQAIGIHAGVQRQVEMDGAAEAGVDGPPDVDRDGLRGLAVKLGIELDEVDVLAEQQLVNAERVVEQRERQADAVAGVAEFLVNLVEDVADLVLDHAG